MSSGATESGKYTDDNGVIYPCRPQPETKGLTLNSVANAYDTGAVATGVPSARLNGSKRTIGVNARTVTVRLTASKEGYKSNALLRIPVFKKSTWDAYSKGQTGTYLATAVEFVGKSQEAIV